MKASFFYISNMKNLIFSIFAISLLSSCATIIGGAKYRAQIVVPNHSEAKIHLNGKYLDEGSAFTKIKRQDAGKLNFKVEEEGFESQKFSFRSTKFRGGAFAGSLISGLLTRLTFTNGTTVTSYPFPIQLFIDLANYSSLMKPDKSENGVSKIDYKNYKYTLNYDPAPKNQPATIIQDKKEEPKRPSTKEESLKDLKRMYDEQIIDDEEYKIMKRRILGITEDEVKQNNNLEEEKTKNESLEGKSNENTKSTEVKTEEADVKEDLQNKEEKAGSSKKELTKEQEEKLSDLNKMLEMGIVSEEEYSELKAKIIEQ